MGLWTGRSGEPGMYTVRLFNFSLRFSERAAELSHACSGRLQHCIGGLELTGRRLRGRRIILREFNNRVIFLIPDTGSRLWLGGSVETYETGEREKARLYRARNLSG